MNANPQKIRIVLNGQHVDSINFYEDESIGDILHRTFDHIGMRPEDLEDFDVFDVQTNFSLSNQPPTIRIVYHDNRERV